MRYISSRLELIYNIQEETRKLHADIRSICIRDLRIWILLSAGNPEPMGGYQGTTLMYFCLVLLFSWLLSVCCWLLPEASFQDSQGPPAAASTQCGVPIRRKAHGHRLVRQADEARSAWAWAVPWSPEHRAEALPDLSTMWKAPPQVRLL